MIPSVNPQFHYIRGWRLLRWHSLLLRFIFLIHNFILFVHWDQKCKSSDSSCHLSVRRSLVMTDGFPRLEVLVCQWDPTRLSISSWECLVHFSQPVRAPQCVFVSNKHNISWFEISFWPIPLCLSDKTWGIKLTPPGPERICNWGYQLKAGNNISSLW